MKFAAPEHVTGIICSTGDQFAADENGQIDIPDNASAAILASLQVAGWTRVADAPAKPASKPADPPPPAKAAEPAAE